MTMDAGRLTNVIMLAQTLVPNDICVRG